MSDINYNTGAATAIGFGVGFFCALLQIFLKRRINKGGVVDSNGAIFQFLIPSFFAAIFVAIAQGVNKSSASGIVYVPGVGGYNPTTVSYNGIRESGRSAGSQGGHQIFAWLFSVAIGLIGGLILGLIFRLVNEHSHRTQFFNDGVLYNYPNANKSEQMPGSGMIRSDIRNTDGNGVDLKNTEGKAPVILTFDYYG